MSALPAAFVRQMSQLLPPDEWAALQAALLEPAPVSIRLNPHKQPADPALLPVSAAPVPWHPRGQYLPERPVFTLDPLLHAGAYYVQEASSMLLREALKQLFTAPQTLKILDLCAAPGGKSTLLATPELAHLQVQLTANEVIRSRSGILRENLERWGCADAAVSSAEAAEWANLPDWFDVVLVDAPCSGEGMFRKDPQAMGEWSPEHVQLCAARQKSILADAVQTLAPGGCLLYSTCTYNSAENANNITWLQQELGLELVPLNFPAHWGLVPAGGGYQCFPHRVRGEGFFLAALRKPDAPVRKRSIPTAFRQIKPLAKQLRPALDAWIAHPDALRYYTLPTGEVLAFPAERAAEFLLFDHLLKHKWLGAVIGAFKGKDFAPSHGLAMSGWLHPEVQRWALTREQSLIYLKKETFDTEQLPFTGWAATTFAGLPLGWVKMLPNRFNNYFPPERRIRMDIGVV
jgi:16S rRNA C967 or C1407 C5-methylase (RsmB/RsmF family)/NOL1/NOP2/fmu family ribosome biogenesis protein